MEAERNGLVQWSRGYSYHIWDILTIAKYNGILSMREREWLYKTIHGWFVNNKVTVPEQEGWDELE